MSLELKEGVTLLGLVPQMVLAVLTLERLYAEHAATCVITAGNDGSHSETSEHYAGRAVDLRTRTLDALVVQAIVRQAQQALGPHFGVLLEDDHIHVHYRPVRPT